jgi:hypothetical protein
MKRHYFSLMSAILLALAVAAFAGDVWKDKPYQQWNQKDVQKILNDSPWAQVDEIVGKSGSVMSAIDAEAANAGGRARIGEDGEKNSVDTSGKFVARWSSSLTVREALLREQQLGGQAPADAAEQLSKIPATYGLVLLGTDLSAFVKAGEESLKTSIYLETKRSRQRIAPSQVRLVKDFAPTSQEAVEIFLEFPKQADGDQPTIASDEKGVDLVATAGKFKLRFHFDFAKMTDKQGRADL